MAEFGNYLKTARLRSDVSLEELAASTRVSVRLLEALENERFEVLPGGIFTISFVRQYARHVGLDENEAVARLKQVTRPVELALGEWQTRSKDRGDDTIAKIAEFFTDFLRDHRMTLIGGVATVLLLAGGITFFHANENVETAGAEASLDDAFPARERVSPQLAELPRTLDIVARGDSASTQSLADDSKPILLEVRLTDRAWVRIVADGERVLEDILEPGVTRTIQAEESVQLVVGNAGGVSVALNGKAMSPVGPPGHVRRVDVSPSGIEVVRIEPKPASGEDGGSSNPSKTQT
jgi:hypothetical protein